MEERQDMKDFIDSLGLKIDGEMRNSQYVITVDNSNEFSSLFNTISLNDLLRLEDNSIATDKESSFRFTNGEYDVVLSADYVNDVYSLIIEVK